MIETETETVLVIEIVIEIGIDIREIKSKIRVNKSELRENRRIIQKLWKMEKIWIKHYNNGSLPYAVLSVVPLFNGFDKSLCPFT